ncbi:hypothetical protein APHCRT_0660 [Anaplasma phagocytophilum str. CRT53-1]|uniref:Uncharacterized protein n=1 Tax=Anaplasma phagocytophilum str. CRT53-1 TaxID=1359157 RepID=A0A0F3Q493_ANAPH|nr:hypothetical protein APHCRT_0660 [Anaplasma phagocytophilum str. CRT53-1]
MWHNTIELLHATSSALQASLRLLDMASHKEDAIDHRKAFS